jgi:hypothetical protein
MWTKSPEDKQSSPSRVFRHPPCDSCLLVIIVVIVVVVVSVLHVVLSVIILVPVVGCEVSTWRTQRVLHHPPHALQAIAKHSYTMWRGSEKVWWGSAAAVLRSLGNSRGEVPLPNTFFYAHRNRLSETNSNETPIRITHVPSDEPLLLEQGERAHQVTYLSCYYSQA